jgi:alpha-ketoglutarate-dependent taurine dioxygenase
MSAVLNHPADTAELDLVPLAGRIGAEGRGLRLSGRLSASTFASIKQALHQNKVLFFRGQQHLDDAEQQAFGRLWG